MDGNEIELKPLKPLGVQPEPKPLPLYNPGSAEYLQPLTTPSGGDATGFLPYKNDDIAGLEDYLNEKQGRLDVLANWTTQSLGGAALGTVEALSYLGDWQQIADKLHGDEENYTNWIAEAMKSAKEGLNEAMPIYRSREGQETFSPGSRSFWTSTTPDVIGSVLSLLIPGTIAGKAGKGLAMGLNLNKLAKTAKGAAAIEDAVELFGSVTASRYAESTMEANQVYKDMIAQGRSIEDAAAAASKTWNTNWLLAGQDLFQYATIMKGMKAASKGKLNWGTVTGDFAGQLASEGGEEGLQYIFAEEAKQAGRKGGYFDSAFWRERLSDYIQADEFKASVALGALGGGVFGGVGPGLNKLADTAVGSYNQVQEKLADTELGRKLLGKQKASAIQGLAVERANLVNDFGTSKKVRNEAFNRIAINHLAENKMSVLKDTWEELKKTPELDEDARKTLSDQIDDMDFLVDQQAQIKKSKIDPKLHNTALLDNLDFRQSGRIQSELDNIFRKTLTEAEKIDPTLVENTDLKKLKLLHDTYKQLESNALDFVNLSPTMIANAIPTFKLYAETLKTTAAAKGVTPEQLEKALVSPKDNELVTNTKQRLLNASHLEELKDRIARYTTPEGQAQIKAEADAKVAEQKIEVEKIAKENLIKEKQAKVDEAQQAEAAQPGPIIPGPVAQDMPIDTGPDEGDTWEFPETPGGITQPTANTEPTALTPEENEQRARWGLAPQPVIERSNVEGPVEPKPTTSTKANDNKQVQERIDRTGVVVTRMKAVRGKWEKKVFIPELDPNGNPIPQEYYDSKSNPVSLEEVFETDPKSGRLYVDTPLLQPGDKVLLIVENDYPYTLTSGFKPNHPDNYVINVYRTGTDGRKVGKPLTQLPSADSPGPNDPTTLINLRDAVLKAGRLETTISSKNVGDPRVSGKAQSLEIFKNDYVRKGDSFEYGKTQTDPIIALAKGNGQLSAPNVEGMKGMDSVLLDDVQGVINMERTTALSPGSRYVLRRNPQGNLQVIQLEGRSLSQAEIDWVKNNLADKLANDDMDTLNEVLNIKKETVGIFKDKPSGRDILRKSKNSLFYITQPKGGRNVFLHTGERWVSIDPKNFDYLIKGEPFLIREVENNGAWSSAVVVATPQETQQINDALNKVLSKSFRNMRQESLNGRYKYKDPASGVEYENYYDFLVKTDTAVTMTPGSSTMSSGADNSYSFYNVGVRINAKINPITVETKKETVSLPDDIIVKDEAPVLSPNLSEEEALKRLTEEGLTRPAVKEGFEVMGTNEVEWFVSTFGEGSLSVAEDVDRVLAKGGLEAFGIYHNALVRLAEFAETGTLYHEAMHFILDPQLGLVSLKEREKVFKEAQTFFGKKSEKDLEEDIAEAFRSYMLSGGKKLPKAPRIKNFFSRLLNAIRRLLGYRTAIENVFRDSIRLNPTLEQRLFFAETRRSGLNITEEKTRLLPGFRSYSQQATAAQVSAYQIMNYAWETIKGTDLTFRDIINPREKEEGPSFMDLYFDVLKKKYKSDFDRIQSIPAGERTDTDKARRISYLAMGVVDKNEVATEDHGYVGQWDNVGTNLQVDTGFKTEVIKAFAPFGFLIQLDDTTEITEADSKERVYGLDATMKDPYKSLSQEIKLFLASIPDPVRKTIYGLPVPIDHGRVFGILSQKLADEPNPLLALENMQGHDPVLKAVYDRLIEEKNAGNVGLINEFNTRFTSTLSRFLSYKKDFDNGVSTIKVMASNRNAADIVIKAKYLSAMEDAGLFKADGSINQNKAAYHVRKIQELRESYNKIRKEKTGNAYEHLREEFKAMLAGLGISLPEQVFSDISEMKPGPRSKTMISLIFGTNAPSFEDFMQKLADDIHVEDNSNVLDVLARRAMKYTEIESGETFLDEMQNQRYPVNVPSALSDLINKIKIEGKDQAIYYEQDKFYQPDPKNEDTRNAFVQLMREPTNVEMLKIFNPLAFTDGNQSPRDFGDRTPADSMLIRLASFVNGSNTAEGKYGYVFIGTHEAKDKQSLLLMPKHGKTAESEKAFLEKVLQNTSLAETVRIQRIQQATGYSRSRYEELKVKPNRTEDEEKEYSNMKFMESNPLVTEIKSFAQRGGQFVYIPGLNAVPNLTASLTNGEVSPEELAVALKDRDRVVAEFIEEQYQSFLSTLERLGVVSIVTEKGSKVVVNETIPISSITGSTDSFLRRFFYFDFGWRHEISKVLNGDLALYKSDDEYFKRGYQLVTPGTKPFNDPSNPESLVTVIFPELPKVNDPEVLASLARLVDTSVTKEEVENHLDGKPSKKPIVQRVVDFHEIKDGADSQTLITVDAWKKIMEKINGWTKLHEKVYQFAWKYDKTVAQAINEASISPEQAQAWRQAALTVTQPLKPFQYNDRVITLPDGNTMIVKEQIKDSRAVLNPEFALRDPGYRTLLQYMREQGIEVLASASGAKVGAYGVITLGEPVQPWQKHIVSLSDIRLPQLNPNNPKTEVLGSQFHKLILGNLDKKGKYIVPNMGTLTGQQVAEEYGDNWAKIHEKDSQSLKEKLGFKDDFQLSTDLKERSKQLFKIKTLLEQELLSRNLNESYADAIRIVLNEMNQPRFAVSIAFPGYSTKFAGVLTNLFKKSFLRSASPGIAGVNIAEFVAGQKADSDLKFITNDKGEVVEAEIGMPVSYFHKLGLNYRDDIDRSTRKIKWHKLNQNQKDALQGILYRIPTSNKSSMLPIRVVRVISPSEGQVIMVPPEVLTQQGLDFDYDKSQILLRSLADGTVDNEAPETKIFNLAWGILTSPLHVEELLTTLTSKNLKAISNVFQAKDKSPWMSPMNPARDVVAEDQNRDAKIMIAIFSRGNTAHAVLQTIEPYVHVDPVFEVKIESTSGYRFNKLGQLLDSRGKLISENFGEYQNAALDSGKDPILFFLSTNKVTAPAVVRLLMTGMDSVLINTFLNQQVIKEWIGELQKEGTITKAFDSLFDKYPGLRNKFTKLQESSTSMKLTEDSLSKNIDTPVLGNLDYSARVLVEFKHVMDTANVARNISDVLSIDTFGDMTGPESVEAMTNKVSDLTSSTSMVKLDPRLFDIKTAPKEAKRLAALYKYALEDALDFVGQFYPYTNQTYKHAKTVLATQLGLSKIFNKDTIRRFNQFLDFYMLETNNIITPVLDKYAPNPRERWTYSSEEKSIIKYIKDMVKKYPSLVHNKMIQGLQATPSIRKGIQMIGLNNTNSRTNKTELTQAWSDLLRNAEPEIRTLGVDLIRFAVSTTGFSYTTTSFADLIPNEFLVSNGIADAHYKLLSGLIPETPNGMTTTSLDANGAAVGFIRHNFQSLSEVPDVYVKWTKEGLLSSLVTPIFDRETKHISSFIIPSDSSLRTRTNIGNFVKIKTSRYVGPKDKQFKIEEYRLYEASPTDPTVFKEIQPLGQPRAYFEVSADGRNKSRVPRNMEIFGLANPWGSGNQTAPPVVKEVPKKLSLQEPMNYKMPASENILGRDTTTFDEIVSGNRTSTTRGYWYNVVKGKMSPNDMVGKIMTFTSPKGGTVDVIVQSVRKITKEDRENKSFLDQWEDSEKWTRQHMLSNTKVGEYQVKFMLASKDNDGSTNIPDCSK